MVYSFGKDRGSCGEVVPQKGLSSQCERPATSFVEAEPFLRVESDGKKAHLPMRMHLLKQK